MAATNEPGNFWGSDVLISMPEPTKHPVLINMGALGMTEFGITHNINRTDLEDYLPTFAPENFGSHV